MLRKVKDFIEQNSMIEKGDRIVLGVSGGADSVCLLYMLSEICSKQQIPLIVVHINHGIRGEDAKRDEQFVAKLCRELKLEYEIFTANVVQIAKTENLSEEEAGRKVRYEAFFQVCKDKKCNKIAIAHNKNDVAETVLFHLFRGTGIRGLSGIQPISTRRIEGSEITIIRPLLCLERKEIEEYLKERNISYQIDATNLTDAYSRNKIRNQILPYAMNEINPNAIAHITQMASQLKEIENFINLQVDLRYSLLTNNTENGRIAIDVNAFNHEDIIIQKGIIRKVIEKLAGGLKDLEAIHVEQVLSLASKQVGKQINLPYGIVAVRDYDRILLGIGQNIIEETDEIAIKPIVIEKPGKYYLPMLHKFLEISIIHHEKMEAIPKSSCMKWFDYDKIENALVVRNRKEGDYIQINATGGRKKLKDYFIDQKIPRMERDKQLLVADGNHIMWILGNGDRISEKYKVVASTKNILLMKLIDAED